MNDECKRRSHVSEITTLRAQVEEARREREVERSCNTANMAELVRADGLLGAALSDAARLREALRAMTEWFWGVKTEDTITSFERVGEEFYADTGMMRPGKSYPMEMYEPDPEVRRKTWDEWVKKKRDALEAKARAALAGKETP